MGMCNIISNVVHIPCVWCRRVWTGWSLELACVDTIFVFRTAKFHAHTHTHTHTLIILHRTCAMQVRSSWSTLTNNPPPHFGPRSSTHISRVGVRRVRCRSVVGVWLHSGASTSPYFGPHNAPSYWVDVCGTFFAFGLVRVKRYLLISGRAILRSFLVSVRACDVMSVVWSLAWVNGISTFRAAEFRAHFSRLVRCVRRRSIVGAEGGELVRVNGTSTYRAV
jgi:hypothetical protein